MRRCGQKIWIAFAILLLFYPQPVSAKCTCHTCYPYICPGDSVVDVANKALKASIGTAFSFLKSVFDLGLQNTSLDVQNAGYAQTMAINLARDADVRAKQAKIDDSVRIKHISTMTKAAAKTAAPSEAGGIACHTISARQVVPVMEQFADITSASVMHGLMAAGRGAGGDYAGPATIREDRLKTCGKMNAGDPATGVPEDEYDSDCNYLDPPDADNPTLAMFRGAGSSVLTLDYETAVLEVPEMVNVTVQTSDGGTLSYVTPRARAGNYKQKLWIVAYDECQRAMGYFPTPPWGRELETSSGMTRAVAGGQCATRQSSFIKQCANRIGYISRPDCLDPQFAPFCEIAKMSCIAARAHGIALPPRFENCEKGLSAYEAEYISHMLCSEGSRQLAGREYGATTTELDSQMNQCSKLQSAWKRKLAKEQKNFNKGFESLYKMQDCWREVKG